MTMNGLMKVQNGVARWMHALVFMELNGCFVNIWNEHIPFECKLGD
jgi:hypothetical protein